MPTSKRRTDATQGGRGRGLRLRTTIAACATATLATSGLALSIAGPAHANGESSLIASFTFDDASSGLAGAGATATPHGTVTLADGADGTKAAKLSSGFWLSATKTDGTALLAGLTDVTFSYDSLPEAAGNTGWALMAERSTTPQVYKSEHYLGVMDKTTGVTVERYNNTGAARDTAGNMAATGTPTGWKHVDIVVAGSTGKLYVNGALVASNATGQLLTDILGASGGVLQLGKADWGTGEYFSGLLDNVKIYNTALTQADVQHNAAQAVADQVPSALTIEDTTYVLPGDPAAVTWTSHTDAITISPDGRTAQVTRPAAGTPSVTGTLTATISVGDQTLTKEVDVTVTAPLTQEEQAQRALAALDVPGLYDVRSDLALPTVGKYSQPVTWTSSNPAVISDTAAGAVAAGVVTRGETDQTVTLTATIDGESRTFTAVVRAKVPAPQTTDYLFAHFTGSERSVTDEQIYFATSSDGKQWTDTRPNGAPVLSSTIGDRGVRDPYLVRSPEGDTFYLIATDLSIYYRGGWGNAAATTTGSLKLVVWQSNDLAHWSAPRLVDVASKIPGAGMAWAPEAFWDADRQQYVVYWATKSSVTELGDPVDVYYATTRDFRTFSDPVKWIDRSHSIIDTTMIKVGDWYYRASGDGEITIERSKNLYAVTTAATAPAYVDDQHWSLVGTLSSIFANSGYSGSFLEGPEFFEYNKDDWNDASTPLWGLMADQYASGRGYLPFRTTNIGDPTTTSWSAATDIDFGALKKRHGTILPVTADELAAVKAAAIGTTGSLVDATAPTLTSVTVDPPGDWHHGAPSLSADASDDSGAAPALEVRVGDGLWDAYGGSLSGLAQGSNTVSVRAVDAAGNRSATTQFAVGYDDVAPVSAATSDDAARTVTVTATDATSGVASIEYSLDGVSWHPYTEPVIVGAEATTVRYRATDLAGNVEAAKSIDVPAGDPGEAAFTSTPTPVITGTAQVGSTVSVSTGRWEPAPVTLAYQWFRADAPIPGASAATYAVSAADLGMPLRVVVTGAKPGYASASVSSAPTAAVAPGRLTAFRPQIAGAAKVGKRVRAVVGPWGPSPVTLAYQWYRGGKRIAGAHGATYRLRRDDRGMRITVVVTGTKAGYTTTVTRSKPTRKVR